MFFCAIKELGMLESSCISRMIVRIKKNLVYVRYKFFHTKVGIFFFYNLNMLLLSGKRSCGHPDAPFRGAVKINGSVAQYSCDMGWELAGKEERNCQSNGIWDGSPPHCYSKDPTGVECPDPPAPTNGRVELFQHDMQNRSLAYYRCIPGYALTGNVSR